VERKIVPEETALMAQDLEIILDIGRSGMTGRSMPNTWGESGARLPLRNLRLRFRPETSSSRELEMQSRQFDVLSEPWFVDMTGQVDVPVDPGSWLVLPDGSGNIVRFTVGLPEGASKRDVALPPDERLYFVLGAWDSIKLPLLQQEEAELRNRITELEDKRPTGFINRWNYAVSSYDEITLLRRKLKSITWPAEESLSEATMEFGSLTLQSRGQIFVKRGMGFAHVGSFGVQKTRTSRPEVEIRAPVYA
jgi:hypothetical protein